ncbi:acyl-coenzyme A:6-aminopenicillanic acid acyl-transferase-domain-containing protein [Biscogniauxia mediterranea]|nr:acyl-coenzyme A:6-aminopenicillanic acid acyl-transferase-domain-containing protein [Biscogniauxia mediterranea]
MLEIRCTGTPHEIGLAHGTQARSQIASSIRFYASLFRKSCAMPWADVVREAGRYVAPLERLAPRHLAEVRGIAAGAGVPFLDVLALNVRTEIAFGLFTSSSSSSSSSSSLAVDPPPSDGCTSLGWLADDGTSFLGQNWDWQVEQAPNLLVCRVSQPGTGVPDLVMVTEAGIVGKIGFNARGVGCCLNALRCRGVDPSRLPVHFALRAVLESESRAAAVAAIRAAGVAGSGHILVGDATGAVGLECTSRWVKELRMDERGRVCHSNHLLLDKADVDEPPWLADSPARLARMRELTADTAARPASLDSVFEVFKDTEGYPASINRRQVEGKSTIETLFTIVMDLTSRRAQVTFGRPTEFTERVVLAF